MTAWSAPQRVPRMLSRSGVVRYAVRIASRTRSALRTHGRPRSGPAGRAADELAEERVEVAAASSAGGSAGRRRAEAVVVAPGDLAACAGRRPAWRPASAVWRAFHVRVTPSSGSSIPFRQTRRNGATLTVTASPPSCPLRRSRSGTTSSPSTPPIRISRSSRIRAWIRAPPRVEPAPSQCARPESTRASANAERVAVLQRAVAVADHAEDRRRIGADVGHDARHRLRVSTPAPVDRDIDRVLLDLPAEAAAATTSAAVRACAPTSRTTSPQARGLDPSQSGAYASSARSAGGVAACVHLPSSSIRGEPTTARTGSLVTNRSGCSISASPTCASEPRAEPDAAQLVRREPGRRPALAGELDDYRRNGRALDQVDLAGDEVRERDPVDTVCTMPPPGDVSKCCGAAKTGGDDVSHRTVALCHTHSPRAVLRLLRCASTSTPSSSSPPTSRDGSELSRQRVGVLVKQTGFPSPIGMLGRSEVWRWSSVERWARDTGRLL